VIQAFNQAHDVRELLKKHGYKPKGNDRFIAPGSTSGLAGVKVFDDGRVYSHHGSDPLGDSHSHDTFSVYTLLDHGGDIKAAVREAARLLGIDSPGERTKRAEGNQEATTPEVTPWPKLHDAALAGIVGEIVREATKNSEADPAAVLMTALVEAGATIGTGPYILISDTVHHARLFSVLVGARRERAKGPLPLLCNGYSRKLALGSRRPG
jgi:hypothetical protein